MQTIFVGGFLRTGTTLVQSILCSGKAVNPMVGECVYLRGLVETYLRCLSLYDEHMKDYFETAEALRDFCAGQAEQFLDHAWRRFGEPEVLVLKHPQLTRYFPPLHVLLPQARFVVCLRDPRDVVASAVTARQKGASEFGTRPPEEIAASLVQTYLPCLGSQAPSFHRQTAYLRYESLVRDPGRVIGKLAAFTGIDLSGFDAEAEKPCARWRLDGSKTQGQPFHSALYEQTISDAHIGRYREVLSEAEAAAVARACGPLFGLFCEAPSVFAVARPAGGGDPQAGVQVRELDA